MQAGGLRPMLVTGFEPFGPWEVNSSWEGVRLLAERRPERFPGGLSVLRLPVDHARASARLSEALLALRPEIALLVGLAGEKRFRLERRARRPLAVSWANGSEERFGAWPWEASRAAIAAAGAPARFSDNCGRYVCETAYRAALDARAMGRGPRLAAFLHVPPLDDEVTPERVADAIEAALAPLGT